MKCKKKKSYWQQGIHKIEYAKAIVTGILLMLLISYIFYGTWVCAVLLSPYLFWYLKSWKEQFIKKKKAEFHLQFKEAIQSISAALNVGYSMENAIKEAIKDVQSIYKKGNVMEQELLMVVRQLQMNIPVEQALWEFALRTEDEDVQTFVTVFGIAKRSGGDLLAIIRNTVRELSEKLHVEREIHTLTAAKKLEFRILSMIPIGLSVYLKMSFPDMLRVLYGNALGVVVMTICLIVYVVSYEMGRRIVEIEV
jgi:tight adherence protein B